jgi:hypothetical protein
MNNITGLTRVVALLIAAALIGTVAVVTAMVVVSAIAHAGTQAAKTYAVAYAQRGHGGHR